MKKLHLFLLSIILMLVTSCDYMSDFSPGSLGSVANTEFSCSSLEIENRITDLLYIIPYKIMDKDTSVISIWMEDGIDDFLNYHCINIRKRLYLITVRSDGSNSSTVSIRGYFNRNKKTWVVAKEFTAADNYHAKKAMEYLSYELN